MITNFDETAIPHSYSSKM